jgi:hypothetical protein
MSFAFRRDMGAFCGRGAPQLRRLGLLTPPRNRPAWRVFRPQGAFCRRKATQVANVLSELSIKIRDDRADICGFYKNLWRKSDALSSCATGARQ